MNSPPAFQFYAADWLADADVTMMTLEEEGAYIRALAFCWREGSIPADEKRLSVLLKGGSREVLAAVKQRFKISPSDSQRLVHGRLDLERKKQKEWREKSSEAGKKSGKVRREKKLSTKPTFTSGSDLVEPRTNSASSSLFSSSSSSSSSTTEKAKKQKTPARSVSDEDLAGTLPLVNGSEYRISKQDVKTWIDTFPGVEIKAELKKFKAWLNANPTRRKTERGINRAIFSWLERKQNSSRSGNNGGKNVAVPNGTGDKIMGLLQKDFQGAEYQDSSWEDGDLSASVKVGPDNARVVHGVSTPVGFTGFSGSDEKPVAKQAGRGGDIVPLPW